MIVSLLGFINVFRRRVVQYCRPDSSRFPFPSVGKPEVQMCKGLVMEVIHRTRTDSDGKVYVLFVRHLEKFTHVGLAYRG